MFLKNQHFFQDFLFFIFVIQFKGFYIYIFLFVDLLSFQVNIKTALCLYFLFVKFVSIFHCSLWTWIIGNLSSHINTDGRSSYQTAAQTSVSVPDQGSTFISLVIYINNKNTKRPESRRPINLFRCAESSTQTKKIPYINR